MTFESDLRGWADKTNRKIDLVVRQAVVLAAQGVILKSPVGNPDLWKGPSPDGYVGGRFRANWTFGVGSPDTTTTNNVDKGGGQTLQRIEAQVSGENAGQIFYVSNSLPYGPRLEYEGWSSQAPAGFVRVTFAELPSQVKQYAKSIR